MSEHPDPQTASEDCRILEGDAFDRLGAFEDNSFHAVVCDPPYGLAFMGRSWDQFEPKEYQEWCERWASECLRVLKPGGHLIAFSGNRTHHRLFTAAEDAGFTIRDTITWLTGNGFPKGASIDTYLDGDTADRFHGFQSSLKPAVEFAVLARAPLSEDAIYKNVLTHGTGGLNIDSCRIPTDDTLCVSDGRTFPNTTNRPDRESLERTNSTYDRHTGEQKENEYNSRYPANLLLSHSPDCDTANGGCVEDCAIRRLDEQSGHSDSGTGKSYSHTREDPSDAQEEQGGMWTQDRTVETKDYSDAGGASRFFYTSKASSSERSCNGEVENEHVAVKPLDLMEHLTTLVTAPGQRVLDPFAGSGTTIMACRRRGREGIGIEQDPDHAELARERVAHAFNIETDFEGDVSPQTMNPETENGTSNASDATSTVDDVPTQPDLDAYGTSNADDD